MSPVHRDPEGRARVATTWRGIADRQIEEAMARGDFDDLPHHGRPLPPPDDVHAGEMAMAFSVLRNAGVAPPWIEADKEVRRLLDERDASLLRARRNGRPPWPGERTRFAELVARINAAIDALNAQAPTFRQHRLPLDPAREMAVLDGAHVVQSSDAADDRRSP